MSKTAYETRREVLIAYLGVKVDMCDWHGAADACCDLRELEAEHRGRRNAGPQVEPFRSVEELRERYRDHQTGEPTAEPVLWREIE